MKEKLFLFIYFLLANINLVVIAQTEEAYVSGEVLFKVEEPFSEITLVKGVIRTEDSCFNVLSDQFQIYYLEPIFKSDKPPYLGWYRAKYEAKVDVPSAITVFQDRSTVLLAQPNAIVRPAWTASEDEDPLFDDQWNLPHIDIPEAWDITSGSSDIVIAVVDIGVDISHEDLENQLWANPGEVYDGIDNDGNGYYDDVHGVNVGNDWGRPEDLDGNHGTFVAGVCCAESYNGKGIAGVAGGGVGGDEGVRLMVVKGPYQNVVPDETTEAEMAEGIRYAHEEGADIINMSWMVDPDP